MIETKTEGEKGVGWGYCLTSSCTGIKLHFTNGDIQYEFLNRPEMTLCA